MQRWLPVLCLGALLFGVRTASPTTVIAPTFVELVDNAREIFVGEVVARRSQWVDAPGGRAIVTLVTFRIVDSLKGGLRTETSLEFLGGTVGETSLMVAGMPEFKVGDRDVVFVGNRSGVSPVMGLGYGRFRITKDPVRGADEVRTFDGAPLSSTSSLGGPRTESLRSVQSLSLSAFRNEIVQRMQNRRAGR